jgi:hypothetical protein
MKFRELLVGKTQTAQRALDAFFEKLGDQPDKILWYPSAGRDYRDLVETHPDRLAIHGIEEQPNIICHTDYYHSWTGLDVSLPSERKILFESKKCKLVLEEKHLLAFSDAVVVDYDGHDYARYYNYYFDAKPVEPIVYFLKIKIFSNTAGEFDAYAFFFIMENYHFLQELILRQKLAITHFVKVREGCGLGGCKNSISVFYSMLGNVGVKYLFIDEEIHYDITIHDHLAIKWGINHQNVQLVPLAQHQYSRRENVVRRRLNWSGFTFNSFKVEVLDGELTKRDLDCLLNTINGNDSADHFYLRRGLFANHTSDFLDLYYLKNYLSNP